MKSIYLACLTCLGILLTSSFVPNKNEVPSLGIAISLSKDSLVHAAGFKLIGESVKKMLAPTLTAEEFAANLKQIKAAKCKVLTCNLFFPANLKIAGPEVEEAKVLAYADGVLSRAQQAGVKYIVLGSSGSRSIPAAYDVNKATTDFINLSKKLGAIAAKYQVTIVLENLEKIETNFITSLKEAAAIVRKVNHPNFRLNVDVFHMMREGESAREIVAAKGLVAFAEVAEKEKRTLPGVMGDDFRPYLKALKEINYRGYIFIEGSIGNAAVEIPAAFKYLSAQVNEVYAAKN